MKSAVTNINTASTTIYNNLFSHDTNGTNSLARFYDSGTNTLYNNVFYSPAQVGTGLSAEETATVVAKNNIIFGFDTGVEKLDTAVLTEDYNLVYGAGSANWSGLTQGSNSISADPKFTNAASRDFTLLASSPAINVGTVTPYTTDRAGVSKQGVPDMGAYEFIDSTAPTISISGASTITQTAGQTFTDPGATATDDVDDSVSVTTSGSVNTSVPGTYTLTYGATDTAGNAATQATRTVVLQVPGNGPPIGWVAGPVATIQPSIAPSTPQSPIPQLPYQNPPAAESYQFLRNLSYRTTHADVRALQVYLNARGFRVAEHGAGAPGRETDYLGALTRAALIKFQEAYTDEILALVGLTKGTGYFGPSTRAFINGD
jgi:hypothetical protein